jgi:hypothetical protein
MLVARRPGWTLLDDDPAPLDDAGLLHRAGAARI